MNPLEALSVEHAALVACLDRREALRAALEVLAADGAVAWVAEPVTAGTDPHGVTLGQVRGDRTGLLRGLHVESGLGLTGKVHHVGRASWVDDYLAADDITHTFDAHIGAEGVRRLLAVPVLRQGEVSAVLAVGARTSGAFGDREIQQAAVVANQVSLAVAVAERARLAREVAVHEERSKLAAELHDSVGALLFAIGSGVAGLAEVAAGDPDLRARLEQLQRQATDASSALRKSLRTLRSSPTALALTVALQGDCVAFADRTGVPAELIVLDEDPPVLAPSRTTVLVSAVREALLNIEKHAQAEAVVVTVGNRPGGGIIVAITDDGVGLSPGHTPGVGLSTTAEAIGRLGGTLRMISEFESGTTCRIELPC
ncbi:MULTISPECIES: GAF domain-containing sensor histidine kinase [Rhodococcus]|uniref:Oxygen sensor histidine kinase NreB n=1 Tax=Rhodococcus oxybenzonivorans TaxID=1990687 RepID=A0AAE4UYL1_9NOCA|nr:MULTISPECIES: GAF domain-containing protein [Rhodococcus]MDV7241715.1 GAF domain-containing protein [Rhodococcus oxybenzonivorans]MDV7264674.1 GAF domain-containing protein [Rhodococcus oxybenzonivorans]MDV7273751.1 GAF domain-containing protein [Rhodococcus oxybenzonivorans]MDV7333997.1 GAF domain-containing protein [Rhodococcus oxybenzonivorans]MDV7343416.1 GAF domain-containing protein [Rhodococcus oxybenzonivorans]